MSEDSPEIKHKQPRPVRYRIREVSPPDIAILFGMVHFAAFLVLGLLIVAGAFDMGAERLFVVGIVGIFGSIFGGFILGVCYNVLAHWHGGVSVGLIVQVEDSPSTKVCPDCGARLPKSRSFCPECDHAFK